MYTPVIPPAFAQKFTHETFEKTLIIPTETIAAINKDGNNDKWQSRKYFNIYDNSCQV